MALGVAQEVEGEKREVKDNFYSVTGHPGDRKAREAKGKKIPERSKKNRQNYIE